jgi:hypothetical protein
MQSDKPGGRVIRFAQRRSGLRVIRGGKSVIDNADLDRSPLPDLSRYQGREGPDEDRGRMIVNAVAFTYTSLLVIAGIWLTMMMVHA